MDCNKIEGDVNQKNFTRKVFSLAENIRVGVAKSKPFGKNHMQQIWRSVWIIWASVGERGYSWSCRDWGWGWGEGTGIYPETLKHAAGAAAGAKAPFSQETWVLATQDGVTLPSHLPSSSSHRVDRLCTPLTHTQIHTFLARDWQREVRKPERYEPVVKRAGSTKHPLGGRKWKKFDFLDFPLSLLLS